MVGGAGAAAPPGYEAPVTIMGHLLAQKCVFHNPRDAALILHLLTWVPFEILLMAVGALSGTKETEIGSLAASIFIAAAATKSKNRAIAEKTMGADYMGPENDLK